jgi:hypothetical protein
MYEEGLDYKLIEKSILETVSTAAVERGSHSIMGILNNVSIGDLGPIGSTAEGRELRKRVTKAIAAKEAARHNAANKAVKAEARANRINLQTQAQEAARQGDFEAADRFLAELNKVDPVAARSVDGFIRREVGDFEGETRAGAFSAALDVVMNSGSLDQAEEAINEAIIYGGLTPEDANKLSSIALRQYDPDTDALSTLERDEYLKGLSSSLKQSFPLSEFGIPLPENADALAQATILYEDTMLQWIEANSDADGQYDRLEARRVAQQAKRDALDLYAPTSGRANQPNVAPTQGVADPNVPDWAQ